MTIVELEIFSHAPDVTQALEGLPDSISTPELNVALDKEGENQVKEIINASHLRVFLAVSILWMLCPVDVRALQGTNASFGDASPGRLTSGFCCRVLDELKQVSPFTQAVGAWATLDLLGPLR